MEEAVLDASVKSDYKPSVDTLSELVVNNLSILCSSIFLDKVNDSDESK